MCQRLSHATPPFLSSDVPSPPETPSILHTPDKHLLDRLKDVYVEASSDVVTVREEGRGEGGGGEGGRKEGREGERKRGEGEREGRR